MRSTGFLSQKHLGFTVTYLKQFCTLLGNVYRETAAPVVCHDCSAVSGFWGRDRMNTHAGVGVEINTAAAGPEPLTGLSCVSCTVVSTHFLHHSHNSAEVLHVSACGPKKNKWFWSTQLCVFDVAFGNEGETRGSGFG